MEAFFRRYAIFSLSILLVYGDDGVIVSTDLGDIRGFHVDYGNDLNDLYYGNGDIFLGIPYVEKPIDQLRFAKPKALTKFSTSPWNATEFKNPCPQVGVCRFSTLPNIEDCLYLNVFSPNSTQPSGTYPVMVFIHGGSFDSGCAQGYPFKGATRTFLSQGILIVTIQYRIGFWGFFTTLTDEYPANRGLLDQIEALKWIQSNIGHFGGDPKKVTIFGESAGSASVSALSFSPLAKGLFNQTIQESGAAMTCLQSNDISQQQAQWLCGLTNDQWIKKDFSSLGPCLQNKSIDDILQFDMAWNMVYDGNFLPDSLENLAKMRPNYPAILGNMRDEYTYFIFERFTITKDLILEDITRSFIEWTFRNEHQYMGARLDEILNIMEQVYHPDPIADDDNIGWTKLGSDIYTGQVFTSMMQQEVDWYLKNKNPNVFLWEQSYQSNVGRQYRLPRGDWDPVPHVAELYFMWLPEEFWRGTENANQTIPFDYQMIDWYSNSWTNFAKYGKPNIDDSWLPVTREENRFFRLDQPTNRGMKMEANWRQTDSLLWNTIIPTILSQPNPTDVPCTTLNPTESPSSILTTTKGAPNSFQIYSRLSLYFLLFILSPIIACILR